MGCTGPRPAPGVRWARASARLSLVGVVAAALASAPLASAFTHAHAAAPVEPSAAPTHHTHGTEPQHAAPGAPGDDAAPGPVHCLACLVGTWALLDQADVDAVPRHTDHVVRPVAPLVAEEHDRHARSRAPPAASAAV